jgi:hypothetical protein
MMTEFTRLFFLGSAFFAGQHQDELPKVRGQRPTQLAYADPLRRSVLADPADTGRAAGDVQVLPFPGQPVAVVLQPLPPSLVGVGQLRDDFRHVKYGPAVRRRGGVVFGRAQVPPVKAPPLQTLLVTLEKPLGKHRSYSNGARTESPMSESSKFQATQLGVFFSVL